MLIYRPLARRDMSLCCLSDWCPLILHLLLYLSVLFAMLLDPWCLRGISGALFFARLSNAAMLLESSGLIPCSSTSVIKTNDFKMTLTPGNATLTINFDGELTYSGKIIMNIDLLVYGYNFLTTQVDLCDYDLSGFCPMTPQNLTLPYTTLTLSDDLISSIPSKFFGPCDEQRISRREFYLSMCHTLS